MKRALYGLYEYYVDVHCLIHASVPSMKGSSANASGSCFEKSKTKSRAEFDSWAQGMDTVTHIKSEP